MDTETRREIDKISQKITGLRQRFENFLSRKGGRVEGQISLDGWLQLESQSTTPGTPATDKVRITARESGGVLQVVMVFPSGKTVTIAQDN